MQRIKKKTIDWKKSKGRKKYFFKKKQKNTHTKMQMIFDLVHNLVHNLTLVSNLIQIDLEECEVCELLYWHGTFPPKFHLLSHFIHFEIPKCFSFRTLSFSSRTQAAKKYTFESSMTTDLNVNSRRSFLVDENCHSSNKSFG